MSDRPGDGRRDERPHSHATVIGGWHRPWAALVVAGSLGVVLALGVTDLPRETARLPGIALRSLAIAQPTWGTTEVVNEVVYGSRGFDTFGETFILVAAVIGLVLLSRSREPRGEYVGEAEAGRAEQASTDPVELSGREHDQNEDAEESEEHGREPYATPDRLPMGDRKPDRSEAMSVFVRVAARPAALILTVLGVYLAAVGYSPGGGFPAGVVLTGVVILLYVAFGRAAVGTIVRPSVLEPVEMVFGAAIVAVGLIGLVRSGSMFANWVPLAQQNTIFAGGNQQVFSGLELVEVGVSLAIAVFGLLGMGHDWTEDDDEHDKSEE